MHLNAVYIFSPKVTLYHLYRYYLLKMILYKILLRHCMLFVFDRKQHKTCNPSLKVKNFGKFYPGKFSLANSLLSGCLNSVNVAASENCT